MNSIDKMSALGYCTRMGEKIAMASNLLKKSDDMVIQGCPYVDELIDLENKVAYVCDAIKNFIKPPKSEICDSVIQPQNFVEMGDYDLDSLKGSIRSKSSEEEEKTEKKNKKKRNKKKAKAVDFQIAKKEESNPSTAANAPTFA